MDFRHIENAINTIKIFESRYGVRRFNFMTRCTSIIMDIHLYHLRTYDKDTLLNTDGAKVNIKLKLKKYILIQEILQFMNLKILKISMI